MCMMADWFDLKIWFQINFKNWGTTECIVHVMFFLMFVQLVRNILRSTLGIITFCGKWREQDIGSREHLLCLYCKGKSSKLQVWMLCFVVFWHFIKVEQTLYNSDFCEHCPWKLAERFLFFLRSVRSYLEWLIVIKRYYNFPFPCFLF